MAAVRIAIEFPQILHNTCPQRIEMEISDEFQKVRLFFHNDGFVAILEEMASSMVTSVERTGVACEERSHGPG
jgi:hypothetical protein